MKKKVKLTEFAKSLIAINVVLLLALLALIGLL
jgi:hypothetical protein